MDGYSVLLQVKALGNTFDGVLWEYKGEVRVDFHVKGSDRKGVHLFLPAGDGSLSTLWDDENHVYCSSQHRLPSDVWKAIASTSQLQFDVAKETLIEIGRWKILMNFKGKEGALVDAVVTQDGIGAFDVLFREPSFETGVDSDYFRLARPKDALEDCSMTSDELRWLRIDDVKPQM